MGGHIGLSNRLLLSGNFVEPRQKISLLGVKKPIFRTFGGVGAMVWAAGFGMIASIVVVFWQMALDSVRMGGLTYPYAL